MIYTKVSVIKLYIQLNFATEKLICKNWYPIKSFGVDVQNGDTPHTTIAMQ